MPRESTSTRIASIAARGMKEPLSLSAAQIIAVCASCLTQFEMRTANKPAAKKRPAAKKKARKA